MKCARTTQWALAAACLFIAPAIAQDDLTARGRYLAVAADCVACHTAPGGAPFAGGYAIASPFGPIYSTNITPSAAGIGDYSEADFARALREGMRRDGAHLYPAMPYTAYTRLTDGDISALYAYFKNQVAPVDAPAPITRLPFPFGWRGSLWIWNALFLRSDRFHPDSKHDAQWNRGAYLAVAVEHCSTCHTPRNLMMAERADRAYAGASVGAWFAPNITSDPVSGVGGWDRQELVQYLGTGVARGKAQAAGGMAEAVSHSLSRLTEDDLNALAVYVKAIPPVRDSAATRPAYTNGAAQSVELSIRGVAATLAPRGALLFSRYCASCHQPAGTGVVDGAYPALFHNTITGGAHADNLIAAILYGVERDAGDKHVLMPGFGARSYVQSLSDRDIADVAQYVVTTYGDSSLHVTAADVAEARRGGRPALIAQLAVPGMAAAAAVVIVLVGLLWWRRRRPTSGAA